MTAEPDDLRARTHGQAQAAASRAALREAYRKVDAFFRRRVADVHTAHDLTQNTFLLFRAWQSKQPGRQPDNLEAFLLRQAAWVHLTHIRNAVRTSEIEVLRGSPADLAVLEDARLLEAILPRVPKGPRNAAHRADLARAVATLSKRQRQALVLRYFDDLRTVQIAQVLACTTRRTNQLINEALQQLAHSDFLDGYGTSEGGHQ